MSQELIRLVNVSKSFGTDDVLQNLDLSVGKHEFITLLGPSGCGKTTLLRIIGGFETPTTGQVLFDGEDITKMPPHKRRVNTIFQRYALFPHMNLFDNIAFGLTIKKIDKKVIKEKVENMLKLVNLQGFENRNINSLSGGQQQRVAIARALVNEPEVLLLDEPLAALDLKLRQEMQLELKNIQQATGITFIHVTHDQEEALTISDKIVVLNKGKIQQQGTPIDIYNEPENAFVASFVGESNIIDGIMKRDCLVNFCGKDFECVDTGFNADEPVQVVIRPEDLKIVPATDAALVGDVQSIIFKGVHYEMMIKTSDFTFMVHSTIAESVGTKVGMKVDPFDIHIMRKEPD